MHTAVLALEDQFNLPLTQELISENDKLRSLLSGTKLPDSQIESMTVPHIFEHKLLMKEGLYNGVYYPKEEILEVINDANEAGIVFDHLDTTQGEGTSNWLGHIVNPSWDENGEDGPGLYGDLKIVDKACAQTLASGPKWGISPAIDYQKNEVGDQVIGTDLSWKSFSFVLSPAVRETMLNNLKKTKGDLNMEPTKEELEELQNKKKKYPYKYPAEAQKNDDIKKKKKEEEEELQVNEQTLKALEARDTEIVELQKFKDDIELSEKTEKISMLVANEFLIGRLTVDDLADREKTLLEKSTEVLTELSDVIGDHADLSAYTDFVKAFMKKHKGTTIAQAAKAWKKKKPKGKGKLSETPAIDTAMPGGNPAVNPNTPGAETPGVGDPAADEGEEGEAEDLEEDAGYIDDPAKPAADLNAAPNAANAATLTGADTPAPGRGLAELKEKGLSPTNEDRAMQEFMLAQGGR